MAGWLANFYSGRESNQKGFIVAHQTIQFLPPEERKDATNKRVENKILLSIPETEFRAIRPHLEAVELDSHRVLHEAHEVLEYAYFPNDRLLSLVVVLADGKTVEAGIAGKEGLEGIPALAGLSRSPLREAVPITGVGLRISAGTMRGMIATAQDLRRQCERCTAVL